jgi:hypothetical protein
VAYREKTARSQTRKPDVGHWAGSLRKIIESGH